VSAETEKNTTQADSYSVAQLCRRWGVGQAKIYRWVDRGELIGLNVATSLSGRPQWRFTAASVAAFEARRSSQPVPKVPRRRRPAGVKDYYPD
jgi:hypothetical protein